MSAGGEIGFSGTNGEGWVLWRRWHRWILDDGKIDCEVIGWFERQERFLKINYRSGPVERWEMVCDPIKVLF